MYILTLPYGKMNLDANNGSSTCCSDECMKVVGIRSMNDSFMLSRHKVNGAIFHCWSGKYYTSNFFFCLICITKCNFIVSIGTIIYQ